MLINLLAFSRSTAYRANAVLKIDIIPTIWKFHSISEVIEFKRGDLFFELVVTFSLVSLLISSGPRGIR
jgi:hypothetical protein